MQKSNHKINDYDMVLDAKFGKRGTSEREMNEDKARDFYTAQILLQARKEANVTQTELAARIHTTKSYISKIENGVLTPSVSTFYKIIEALGFRVEIVNSIL